MFTEFLNRLTRPAPDADPAPDAWLVLGALLVRIAKSDHEYAVQEIGQIDAILSARFGLNAVEAAKLRAQAEKLEASAPDTQDFAAAVKDAIPYADRSAIVEALWEVVQADGVKSSAEASLFASAAHTLGIDTTDLENR